jgi:hypothetical protein
VLVAAHQFIIQVYVVRHNGNARFTTTTTTTAATTTTTTTTTTYLLLEKLTGSQLVKKFPALYGQVTVHHDKLHIKQPTRCIKYPKFILT